MKNSVFIIFFLILNTPLFPFTHFNFEEKKKVDNDFLRTEFYKAIEDESALDNLIEYIEDKYSSDTSKYSPRILAYWGGIQALKAKHSFWIFNKISHVISSLDILESAVNKMPNDLEIRFMRFSILHNIPDIFGVSEDRENDANKVYDLLMRSDYSLINKDIQQGMIQFLIDSERLPEEKVKSLNSLYSSSL